MADASAQTSTPSPQLTPDNAGDVSLRQYREILEHERQLMEQQSKILQDGLNFFFDFIVGASGNRTEFKRASYYNISLGIYRSVVMDAAGTGSNVAVGVDEENRKRFVEHAIRSRNKMIEADKALSTDTAIRRGSEALKK